MKLSLVIWFFIVLAILFFGLTQKTTSASLEDFKVPPKIYKLNDTIPETEIVSIISQYATGTKAYQMKRTIFCESGYENIQSHVVKNGIREDSWGVSQIHLPSHPTVSKEETLDVEFAIKFMSDNFYKVKWYGYNRETDRCNLPY